MKFTMMHNPRLRRGRRSASYEMINQLYFKSFFSLFWQIFTQRQNIDVGQKGSKNMVQFDHDAATFDRAGRPEKHIVTHRAAPAAAVERPLAFLGILFLTVVLVLSAIVAANWRLAPMQFSQARMETVAESFAAGANYANWDLNVDIRGMRRAHIARLTETPDLIVQGASHWQEASADLLPDVSYYNAHVHRDYYEDLLAVAELLIRHDRLPKTLVLTIRDQTFLPVDRRTDSLWRYIGPEYHDMAARLGVPSHSWAEIFPFADFVGLSSLVTLREKALQYYTAPVRPGPTKEDKLQTLDVLMPDGSIRWSHDHDAIFTPERARRLALEGAAERKNAPIVIDPDGVKAVDRLVGLLAGMGVDVVLAHPPFNPVFYDEILGSEYDRGLQRVTAIAARIAATHGARVIGSFNPNAVGCSQEMYIDMEHSKPACLGRLLQQALPQPKPAAIAQRRK